MNIKNKKNSYINKLRDRANSNRDKLEAYIGKERADEYLSSFSLFSLGDDAINSLEDNYIYSQYGLELRCVLHFNEACAYISALENDLYECNRNFEVDFTVVFFDEKQQKVLSKTITEQTHREAMLERLEWISGQNFTHDYYAWLEWKEVVQEDYSQDFVDLIT